MSTAPVRRAITVLGEAGAVLFAWWMALVLEHLAVGFGWRDLLAGSWEMGSARTLVSPIVLALLVPAARQLTASWLTVRKSPDASNGQT